MADIRDVIRERIESPEGHAALWKVITDAEASGDAKAVKEAKQLRRRQEQIDGQRGLPTPPDGAA